MKATQLLRNLGQSLWLDNITRDLLDSGTLKRYIDELSVTGLTAVDRPNSLVAAKPPWVLSEFRAILSSPAHDNEMGGTDE